MNISGIGSYSGSYNSIKINSLLNQQMQSTAAKEPQATRRQQIDPQEQQAIRAKQNFNSEDYAKQYEPGKSYEMKGSESDIASLDARKSVTAPQKSQIMQQYQLFMGETQAQGINQSAMNSRAVRGVENFAL